MGSYHCCRALVKHNVCSPTAVISFTNIDGNWSEKEDSQQNQKKNDEHASTRLCDQMDSIREGYYYPPQYIYRTIDLQYGLTAYGLVVVSKEKAKTTQTKEVFEKLLQVFRAGKTLTLTSCS